MGADELAIETIALSKTYPGGVRALAELDLRVEHGEVFGFLGPNGAGKSTTIRLLLDLIRPTGGHALLFGLDSRRDGVAARRMLGYLPGDLRLFERLTGREQLESLARLRGAVDPALQDALVERFGVVLDRPIRELSKGNRQKVGIGVLALLHGWLAVAVAALTPSRALATGVPAELTAAAYLVAGLHDLAGWLDPLRFASSFWWVGRAPLQQGVSAAHVLVVVAAAAATLAAAAYLIDQRDLRTP